MLYRMPFSRTARGAISRAAIVLVCALGCAFGLAPSAFAQEQLPVSAVDRPLTEPQGTLVPQVALFLGRGGSLLSRQPRKHDIYAGVGIATDYAITNDFEIGSRLMSINVAPVLEVRLPTLGITQRIVRGFFELGLDAGVQPNLREFDPNGFLLRSEGVDLWAGVPMRFHVAGAVKLFFSPSIDFSVPFASRTANDTTFVSVSLPVSAYFRIVDPFSLGLGSGCTILRLDKTRETTVVPLGMSALITIPSRNRPAFDIAPSFSFPYLFAPSSPFQRVNADLWTATLSFSGYVYL